MDKEQAIKFMRDLMGAMVRKGASDLFVTVDFPPALKIQGKIMPVSQSRLSGEDTRVLCYAIMNDRQLKEYESTKECNFAVAPKGIGRFRVNVFIQQGYCGMVLRTIQTEVPTIEDLALPKVLGEIIMNKRGMVIMVGGTGSGKSTSLAAMINHRNLHSHGHIITIEDPIEYVHPHKKCIIMQREVGVDTETWESALKNTLRQAPDVILLGEIRDQATMEHAVAFAETGHLAVATLHANSANQALDRVINFFSEERRSQLLLDLSSNLRAIVSQRLLRRKGTKERVPAIEILLNSPLICELIIKGEVHRIKEIMAKSREIGMQTFDQALFDLHESDLVTEEDALRNADSMNELRLKIKLEGKKSKDSNLLDSIGHLDMEEKKEESGVLR
ncbi:MAG: PilT/PilU family type 4a pilus ATPase [Candidatus Porifericomitaceae bacterium WSBS_2022_MAG_OTU9]